jgi:hypothetical protein
MPSYHPLACSIACELRTESPALADPFVQMLRVMWPTLGQINV